MLLNCDYRGGTDGRQQVIQDFRGVSPASPHKVAQFVPEQGISSKETYHHRRSI